MRQHCDRGFVDAALTELRQEDLGEIRVGLRRAAAGLGGIEPAAVLAEQNLPAESGVEQPGTRST
jgi:hypothetical protein